MSAETERQEFELSVADRISGPTNKINEALNKAAGTLDKLQKATKGGANFADNLAKSSGKLQGLTDDLKKNSDAMGVWIDKAGRMRNAAGRFVGTGGGGGSSGGGGGGGRSGGAGGPLGSLLDQLKQSEREFEKLHAASNGPNGFFASLLGKLTPASMAMGVLGKTVEGVGWALKQAWEFGKGFVTTIVEAAKQRGLLMTAYEVMLGSREKAEKQLQKTLDIASITPASNIQTADMTKRLLTGGFTGRRLDATRAGAMDVQAAFGDNRMNQFIYTMTKAASRGEARNSDINSFGMYINARGIRENIAKMMGAQTGFKEGKAYDNVMDRKVQELIKHHGVSSAVLEVAVQKALMEELKQQKLGAYAKKKGIESLAGLLSNLEEIIPTFLMRLDIDHFAGIKELKRFLTDLLSFFSLGTKEGKMMAQVVEDLTNELFGGLKNITRDDMAKGFRAMVTVAKQLQVIIREAWGWMDKLLHGNADDLIASTAEVLVEVGRLLGMGIWEGFKAAMGFGGRQGRRPFEPDNMDERRRALERQGHKPGDPVYEAGMRAPVGAFKRMYPGTAKMGEGGPRLDMSGTLPVVPATPGAPGVPTAPSGVKLEPLPPDFLEKARELGENGGKSYIEGLAGPEGLDTGSPSKKAKRIGKYGAEGYLSGLESGAEKGGAGVTVNGDLNIHVQADSVTQYQTFRDWLTQALQEEAEGMGA